MPLYVGLDVHLKTCYATAMNERGEILRQEKFANEGLEIERFFKDMKDAKVAIEASYSWMPVYELLEGKGYEVKLAHPKETRIIAKGKVKTDKVDSERLAHLLRSNLLPTSYVPPKEIRELRDIVRLRAYLVRERAKFKNKIRAELAKRGIHVFRTPSPKTGYDSVKAQGAWHKSYQRIHGHDEAAEAWFWAGPQASEPRRPRYRVG